MNTQSSCRRFETPWRLCDLPVMMYAFWLINFMNFSKHHRQTCKHLSKKSTNGPALPRNLQFKKRSWLKGNGLHHDDVIKWKHFLRYWPFVRGIHRSSVNSPHKGQWRGALMFSLICVWINGWVNNREAGDLRRYRAHYDVTVMYWQVVVPEALPTLTLVMLIQCISRILTDFSPDVRFFLGYDLSSTRIIFKKHFDRKTNVTW